MLINIRQQVLITVEQNPSWQPSLAQLSPSLLYILVFLIHIANVYMFHIFCLFALFTFFIFVLIFIWKICWPTNHINPVCTGRGQICPTQQNFLNFLKFCFANTYWDLLTFHGCPLQSFYKKGLPLLRKLHLLSCYKKIALKVNLDTLKHPSMKPSCNHSNILKHLCNTIEIPLKLSWDAIETL